MLDDDHDDRHITETVFAEKGYDVKLEFLDESDKVLTFLEDASIDGTLPHLILLDLNMPRKNGFEVLGVSPDDESKQKKFEIKYKLPFPLIADTENKITAAYGVHDMKKLFGREYMGILRTTFVIDKKGIIQKIFHKPKNKAHAQEILKSFE